MRLSVRVLAVNGEPGRTLKEKCVEGDKVASAARIVHRRKVERHPHPIHPIRRHSGCGPFVVDRQTGLKFEKFEHLNMDS